jgi:hypothetical protein
MKTGNEDFLNRIARKAVGEANRVDTGELKVRWPKRSDLIKIVTCKNKERQEFVYTLSIEKEGL